MDLPGFVKRGRVDIQGFHKVESPGSQREKSHPPTPFQRENRAPEGEKSFFLGYPKRQSCFG
jgi:hypothetical protein